MDLASILVAIAALALVIFAHEMGHFLIAKWCDVEVRTFSIGFGPTVFSRRRGETEYRLGLIPLGGYVSMAGTDDGFGDESLAAADSSRGFSAKSITARAAIIAGGPFANFVFAVVVFAMVSFAYGVNVPVEGPVVGDLTPGAAAERAGLESGDTIVSIDGLAIAAWIDIPPVVGASEGKEMSFVVYGTNGTERTVAIRPEHLDSKDMFGEVTGKRWYVGIGRPIEKMEMGAFESVSAGFAQTAFYTKMIGLTLVRLVQGRLSGDDVGGPIMIAREAGRQVQYGAGALMGFMALISINLGMVNLLPFPVLDGGHLVFLAFEAISGKPLPLKVRDGALQLGVVVLGALMIFVVYNDIVNIARG